MKDYRLYYFAGGILKKVPERYHKATRMSTHDNSIEILKGTKWYEDVQFVVVEYRGEQIPRIVKVTGMPVG